LTQSAACTRSTAFASLQSSYVYHPTAEKIGPFNVKTESNVRVVYMTQALSYCTLPVMICVIDMKKWCGLVHPVAIPPRRIIVHTAIAHVHAEPASGICTGR